MRTITAITLLWLGGVALAQESTPEPTLDQLEQDAAKKKYLGQGRKTLDQYFKAESEVKKPKQRRLAQWINKQDEAMREFKGWLAGSQAELGVDLRTRADLVIRLLDEARIKYLSTKIRKGRIDYVKVPDPKGMERHEYATLIPRAYDPKKGEPLPVVITLHGRVINDRHPAFRSADFTERSRVPIYNNWAKEDVAEKVLVIAPTTSPDGFKFSEESQGRDLQALYRTLGEVLTNYRADWNRVFVEVEGEALRVCCQQAMMFAGFIVRDRIDDRRRPFIPEEEWFILDNLNGTPLLYVADEKHWDKVGQPMSEAFKAAYQKAGKPQNLVIVKAKRTVDGALKGAEKEIAQFVTTHRRPAVRKSFVWRFHRAALGSPFPIDLGAMNFNYNVGKEATDAPLAAKAGKVTFDVTLDNKDGQDYNRVVINVTEAESLTLRIYDGLINFDLPTTVIVNGTEMISMKKYDRNWDLFLDAILPRRFFMIPMLNVEEIKFEHMPEFVPPKPEPPLEGAGGEEGTETDGAENGKDAAKGK